MSYDSTTGVISAPVTLNDVKNATGWQPNQGQPLDLENLCLQKNGSPDGKINMWARYRPTGYGSIHNRMKSDGTNESKSLMYGLSELNSGGNEVAKNVTISKIGQTNFTDSLTWKLEPDFKYFRLQDFSGYNKNAECNVTSDFFKPATIGKQTGLFYSTTLTIINFQKDHNFASEPPQCWENHSSSDNYDYCSRLYFEELFSNAGGLSGLYLGVAFKWNNTWDNYKAISVGRTIGYLMNNNVSMEDIMLSGTKVGILNSVGGRIMVALNFDTIHTVDSSFLPNVPFYSRLVLMGVGSSSPTIYNIPQNPNDSVCYSFEISPGFCMGSKAFSTLNNFVNLKNGGWTGYYIERGREISLADSANYEVVSNTSNKNPFDEGWYKYTSGSYVRTSDTTPVSGTTYYRNITNTRISNAVNNSVITNRIFIKLDQNKTEEDPSWFNTDNYYKFYLSLGDNENTNGVFCYEFYAGGTTSEDNIFVNPSTPTVVVSANVKLYLAIKNSSQDISGSLMGYRYKNRNATWVTINGYGDAEYDSDKNCRFFLINEEEFTWKNQSISPSGNDPDYGLFKDKYNKEQLSGCGYDFESVKENNYGSLMNTELYRRRKTNESYNNVTFGYINIWNGGYDDAYDIGTGIDKQYFYIPKTAVSPSNLRMEFWCRDVEGRKSKSDTIYYSI